MYYHLNAKSLSIIDNGYSTLCNIKVLRVIQFCVIILTMKAIPKTIDITDIPDTNDSSLEVIPKKNNTNRKRDKEYDTMDMIAMRLVKGMSLRDIEKITGKSRTAIDTRIKKVVNMFDPESIAAYEQHKPAILTGVERVLVQDMLDPRKREDASLNNVAYAFAQVNKANLLSRGSATEIIDTGKNVKDLAELKAKTDMMVAGLLSFKD